jgi:hypothetical protein
MGFSTHPPQSKSGGNIKKFSQLTLILILVFPLTTSSATVEEDKPYEFIKVIDPPEPNNHGFFGSSMAMSGDRIVVGEYGASRAHIYDRDGILIKTLQPPDGNDKSRFGQSVTVFHDQIVVGESYATANGLKGAGQIHFYDHEGNFIKTLQSPQPQLDGGFGFSIADDGEKLVVSEPGINGGDENFTSMVYLFDEGGAITGSFKRPQLRMGSYGWSVGIRGDILVVGEPYAWYSTDLVFTHGIIHIYNVSESRLLMSIRSPIGKGFGNFGGSVSVGDDIIAVGEVRGDANNTMMAGTAHLYSINGTLIKTLYPVSPKIYGYFGIRVFVSESYVAVNQAGYIYLYDHLGNPSFTISEENLAAADFGYDLIIDGNRLAAGIALASAGGKQYAGEVNLYQLKTVDQNGGFNMLSIVEALAILVLAVTLVVLLLHHRRENWGKTSNDPFQIVQI